MNSKRFLYHIKRQGNKVATFLKSRDVVTFLFFFVLAFFLWYMYSIGTQREITRQIPIQYIGIPDNVVLEKELPKTLKFVIKDEVKTTTIVMQYHSRYVTTEDLESTIPIQIPEYNETLDIMYVYINGIKLVYNYDYIISGNNIQLARALDVVGTPVEFEVLKSVDTAEASSIVVQIITYFNKVDALENRVESLETFRTQTTTQLGGLTFERISEADFDDLSEKDVNTCYYVYDESGRIKQYIGDTVVNEGSFVSGLIEGV